MMETDFITSLPTADLGTDSKLPAPRVRPPPLTDTYLPIGQMQYDATVRLYDQLCGDNLLAECMPQLSGLVPSGYDMQYDSTVPANLFSDGESSGEEEPSPSASLPPQPVEAEMDPAAASLFTVGADGTVSLDLASLRAVAGVPDPLAETQLDGLNVESLFGLGDQDEEGEDFTMPDTADFSNLDLDDSIHPSFFEHGIAASDMSSLLEQFEEAAATLPEIEPEDVGKTASPVKKEIIKEEHIKQEKKPTPTPTDVAGSEVMRLLMTKTPTSPVKAAPKPIASPRAAPAKTVPKVAPTPKGLTAPKVNTPPPEVLEKIRSSTKRKSTIMLPTVVPAKVDRRRPPPEPLTTRRMTRGSRSSQGHWQQQQQTRQPLRVETSSSGRAASCSSSAPSSPKVQRRPSVAPYSAPVSPVHPTPPSSLLTQHKAPLMTRNVHSESDLKSLAPRAESPMIEVSSDYYTCIPDHDYCQNSRPVSLQGSPMASQSGSPTAQSKVGTSESISTEDAGSVLKSLLLKENLNAELRKQMAVERRRHAARKVSVNLDVIDMEIEEADGPRYSRFENEKDSLGDAHVIGGIAVGLPLPPLPPLDQLPRDCELRALEDGSGSNDSNDSVRPANDMNVILNKVKRMYKNREQGGSPTPLSLTIPKPNKPGKPSNHSRPSNHSKPSNHSRPSSHSRSSSHSRQGNHPKLSSHSRHGNHSKPSNHTRPSNHAKPPNHTNPSNYTNPSNHSKPSNHTKPPNHTNHSKPSNHTKPSNHAKPSFPNKPTEIDANLFDKMPGYFTALRKAPKPEKSKVDAHHASLSSAVPTHDRDPSPERDPGFSKLPSYLCFTNSTKYDDSEQPEPTPAPASNSTATATINNNADMRDILDTLPDPVPSPVPSPCPSPVQEDPEPTENSTPESCTPVDSTPSSRSETPCLYIASRANSESRPTSRAPSRTSSPSRSPSPSSPSPSPQRQSESSSREASCSPSPDRSRSRVRRRNYRRKRHSYSSSHSSSGSRSRSRSRSRLRSPPPDNFTSQRSMSRSVSRSRSRSRSGSRGRDMRNRGERVRNSFMPRSRSRSQDYEDDRLMKEKIKKKRIEERRIVYVGRIASDFTRRDLRRQFERFGEIEDVSVHFREHGGDNYGFVTFIYTCDAYAAIEKGNKVPGMERYDLCFGGRREFCKTEYADLDGNMEMEEEMAPLMSKPSLGGTMDFDELLRQARTKIKKPAAKKGSAQH